MRKLIKDKKLYPIQCDREKVDMAIEYCKNNNISLSTELRNIIYKYGRLQKELEENKMDKE